MEEDLFNDDYSETTGWWIDDLWRMRSEKLMLIKERKLEDDLEKVDFGLPMVVAVLPEINQPAYLD